MEAQTGKFVASSVPVAPNACKVIAKESNHERKTTKKTRKETKKAKKPVQQKEPEQIHESEEEAKMERIETESE